MMIEEEDEERLQLAGPQVGYPARYSLKDVREWSEIAAADPHGLVRDLQSEYVAGNVSAPGGAALKGAFERLRTWILGVAAGSADWTANEELVRLGNELLLEVRLHHGWCVEKVPRGRMLREMETAAEDVLDRTVAKVKGDMEKERSRTAKWDAAPRRYKGGKGGKNWSYARGSGMPGESDWRPSGRQAGRYPRGQFSIPFPPRSIFKPQPRHLPIARFRTRSQFSVGRSSRPESSLFPDFEGSLSRRRPAWAESPKPVPVEYRTFRYAPVPIEYRTFRHAPVPAEYRTFRCAPVSVEYRGFRYAPVPVEYRGFRYAPVPGEYRTFRYVPVPAECRGFRVPRFLVRAGTSHLS
ncbi:hypothetical protein DIPPA_33521 [Diplonema papillatum]|nr:hypothetical protein DIPPA_33521 [Diplonema papillatum]